MDGNVYGSDFVVAFGTYTIVSNNSHGAEYNASILSHTINFDKKKILFYKFSSFFFLLLSKEENVVKRFVWIKVYLFLNIQISE